MFLKLTPARRVLRVLAFGCWWIGHERIRPAPGAGLQVDVNFPAIGVALLLIILMLELKDKLLARNELADGRSVQRALMPPPRPSVPGWDLWLFTRSANDVGGDLVDFLRIDERRYGVALGDVAGKGLGAALLMARLQATLRALVPEFPDLGDLGARLNHIFHRDGPANRFASLVYLDLERDRPVVRLLNAGHMPPLVLRRHGAVEDLPRGSAALGVLKGATFEEQAVTLDPGDLMLVYSDGLTEACAPDGDFFGDDRLRAVFATTGGLDAESAGTRVLGEVDAFVRDARPFDDLSLVVLGRLPSLPAASPAPRRES
jgi:sigma-B regulation protein RsbU (phosphoserine phosphatase)